MQRSILIERIPIMITTAKFNLSLQKKLTLSTFKNLNDKCECLKLT